MDPREMDPRESLAHLDSKLLEKTSSVETVDRETQTKEHGVNSVKDEEEEKKELRDMIEIEHVIVYMINNHTCEYFNIDVKASFNGKLNICIELGSFGSKATIVVKRDIKEQSVKDIEPVRKE